VHHMDHDDRISRTVAAGSMTVAEWSPTPGMAAFYSWRSDHNLISYGAASSSLPAIDTSSLPARPRAPPPKWPVRGDLVAAHKEEEWWLVGSASSPPRANP
jgi:hypothetical protein